MWPDPALLLSWLGLALLGIALLWSTSHYQPLLVGHPGRQLLFVLLGLILQLLLARQPLSLWFKLAPLGYGLSLLLLALVPWLGLEINGARRWLPCGPLGAIQPSEFIKVWLLLWQVQLVHQRRWLAALAVLLPPALLALKQPDLGTAACYGASTLVVCFLGGANLRWLVAGLVMSLVGLGLGLHDYQRQRLLIFLNPEQDPTGAGWNLIQAKIAVGSGGLAGLGWLQGLQKRLMFVPEQHTDFIFTVLAEEAGWLGSTLVLLLFGLFLSRCFGLAQGALQPRVSCLCAAIAGSLGFQALVNLAMVVGLCPVTGIPLPLVSYGGSALLSQCCLFGLLQSEAGRQARSARLQPRLLWSPRG